MRNRLCVLLVAAVAAASPEGDPAAQKEKIQAMLDEAALLEQAGRRDEAARVREEAKALARKLEARGQKDDPRMQALANLEKTIGSLEKAGYEGMAKELRGMADRLRAEVKGGGGKERIVVDRPDADFWRRNLDTLHIARKGLAEAERRDAADLMERAIRARELMLEGRGMDAKGAPDDPQLSELLFKAGQCWREFKQPEHAERCEELGRYFQHRVEEQKRVRIKRAELDVERGFKHEGQGADDRLARIEERIDRMERMLFEALRRLEARDREGDLEFQRELDREKRDR